MIAEIHFVARFVAFELHFRVSLHAQHEKSTRFTVSNGDIALSV